MKEKMEKDETKTFLLRNIPAGLHRELKVAAAKEGKPVNRVIIELIASYVGHSIFRERRAS